MSFRGQLSGFSIASGQNSTTSMTTTSLGGNTTETTEVDKPRVLAILAADSVLGDLLAAILFYCILLWLQTVSVTNWSGL